MYVTLCEYASVSSDGTATLVRSGIERLVFGNLPSRLGLSIYVELLAGDLEVGTHPLQIQFFRPGDASPIFRMEGDIDYDGKTARLAPRLDAALFIPGQYRVDVRIGKLSAERVVTIELRSSITAEVKK